MTSGKFIRNVSGLNGPTSFDGAAPMIEEGLAAHCYSMYSFVTRRDMRSTW